MNGKPGIKMLFNQNQFVKYSITHFVRLNNFMLNKSRHNPTLGRCLVESVTFQRLKNETQLNNNLIKIRTNNKL
jgi:hypothetical protein